MPEYYIIRFATTDYGTIGELKDVENNHICYTCELPWLNNEPDKSCIPTGIYNVIPHDSPAHPHVWEITNVPDRSGILIHNGNTETDSEGCVLVGDSIGIINKLPAVLNSDETLESLRGILPLTFTLTIKDFL